MVKDARHRTSWDRAKYNFAYSFFGPHGHASWRRMVASRDDPMDPKVA